MRTGSFADGHWGIEKTDHHPFSVESRAGAHSPHRGEKNKKAPT
jgi:hypothetical protein